MLATEIAKGVGMGVVDSLPVTKQEESCVISRRKIGKDFL